MLNLLLLGIMILICFAVGVTTAMAANSAKKARNPDKFPSKRGDAVTLSVTTGAIAFGAIVLVMMIRLGKDVFTD